DMEKEKEELRSLIASFEEQAMLYRRTKKWLKALGNYKQILDNLNNHPDLYERKEYERKKQDCIFNIGVLYYRAAVDGQGDVDTLVKSARESLEKITKLVNLSKGQQVYHGEAYYYLARTHALIRAKKPQEKGIEKTIKELLINAKKHGFNVFVGIAEDPNLHFLKQDPAFLLDILKTPTFLTITEISNLKDPFDPKVQIFHKPSEQSSEEILEPAIGNINQGEVLGKKEQEALLKEIEQTFLKLKNALKQSSRDAEPKKEVIMLWQRLQEQFKKQDDIILPSLRKRLTEIQKNYNEMEERLEKVQLGFYYQQGTQILQQLREAFSKKRYQEVLRHWDRLFSLAKEMSKNPNENFRKTADSLLNSGQNIRRQAVIYLKLRTIRHEVTGIVIQYFPKKLKIAIVNDRPYFEGDAILNENDEEMDLRIAKIEPGKVKFVYQGVEVEKLLRE
ncbi:MAG: hypothetical protein D6785_08190, partial [Planctomycetota bacterium]